MENPPFTVNPELHWRILGRRYRLILGLTFACALGAAVFSLLQLKVYRASTYLLLSESKIDITQTSIPNYVYGEVLKSYETSILNDEMLLRTIEHFGLQAPPYSLTVDDIRKRKIIQVEWTKNTRLLEVSVEFPDPRLATDIVNFFVSAAVRFNDQLNAMDIEKARSFLKQQLTISSQQLESAQQRLNQFGQSSDLDLASQKLLTLSELDARDQRRLLQLGVERARALARKDRLLHDLNEVQSKAAPLDAGTNSPVLGGDRGSGEVGNKLHELQRKIAESTAEVMETDAAIEVLKKSQENNRRELVRVQKEKTKENLQRQLLDEYQSARDNYDSLDWKYQDAATAVSSRSTDLKVVAPAIPPTRPYKPWIALNTILGGALGLMVSIPLSLLLHFLESAGRTGSS